MDLQEQEYMMERSRLWTTFIGETGDGRLWVVCQDFDRGKGGDLLKPAHWTDSGRLFRELLSVLDASIYSFLATTELGQSAAFTPEM